MNKLGLTRQWREDVASGEMITTHNYTKTHLGFDRISDKELKALCKAVNTYYSCMGSKLRVSHHMGEIIPV